MEESATFDLRTQRYNLLPLWIKVFVILFMISGAMIPVSFLLKLLGYDLFLPIYGLIFKGWQSLESYIWCSIFLFKGVVAYNLWSGKNGAILLGQIDAIAGIILCVIVMIISLFVTSSSQVVLISLRYELIFLIPYLIKMNKLEFDWAEISAPNE